MGSHIPTLRPKYIPYSYMDPLGLVARFVLTHRLRIRESHAPNADPAAGLLACGIQILGQAQELTNVSRKHDVGLEP